MGKTTVFKEKVKIELNQWWGLRERYVKSKKSKQKNNT